MSEAMDSLARSIAEHVAGAAADKTPLRIQGGGSKSFYGRQVSSNSQPLDVGAYRGIVSYEPTELVVTARAGTPLTELESTLAEKGQMLGFEPPHFAAGATIGGIVACGLSGPRRPYAGAARDFVLGAKIINGKGEILSFGGQVMKNVAGYDVSRLMAGSLGTLGVILEVSLKVLPLPAAHVTLARQANEGEAIVRFAEWGGKPYPISAACQLDDTLFLRLSGAASAVDAAADEIGGERFADSDDFWRSVREQTHPYFNQQGSLWRFSIPPATDPLQLGGPTLIDWGGAQRWLIADHAADTMFAAAAKVGGHAGLFRGGDRTGQIFQPLAPGLLRLQQRLKQSFDPAGVLNPGRLYLEF